MEVVSESAYEPGRPNRAAKCSRLRICRRISTGISSLCGIAYWVQQVVGKDRSMAIYFIKNCCQSSYFMKHTLACLDGLSYHRHGLFLQGSRQRKRQMPSMSSETTHAHPVTSLQVTEFEVNCRVQRHASLSLRSRIEGEARKLCQTGNGTVIGISLCACLVAKNL